MGLSVGHGCSSFSTAVPAVGLSKGHVEGMSPSCGMGELSQTAPKDISAKMRNGVVSKLMTMELLNRYTGHQSARAPFAAGAEGCAPTASAVCGHRGVPQHKRITRCCVLPKIILCDAA